jgi:hypothetical protein
MGREDAIAMHKHHGTRTRGGTQFGRVDTPTLIQATTQLTTNDSISYPSCYDDVAMTLKGMTVACLSDRDREG